MIYTYWKLEEFVIVLVMLTQYYIKILQYIKQWYKTNLNIINILKLSL